MSDTQKFVVTLAVLICGTVISLMLAIFSFKSSSDAKYGYGIGAFFVFLITLAASSDMLLE